MRRYYMVLLAILFVLGIYTVAFGQDEDTTYIPSVSGGIATVGSPTPTATSTETGTATATHTPTSTPTATTEGNTPTPTNTPTSTPTNTPTATATSTPVNYAEQMLVPAGEFQMGCDQSVNASCGNTGFPSYYSGQIELPLHTVYLDAYYIDKYEVTNGRYQECVEAGNCSVPQQFQSGDYEDYYSSSEFVDFPVVWVNKSQARDFCEWVGMRLPTEAEWEKAARGDQDTRIYPWGNEALSAERANYASSNPEQVGFYPDGASPYGAMDMIGNVSEWVSDWYHKDYYKTSPSTNPLGADTNYPYCAEYELLRGGSYYPGSNRITEHRVTYRQTLAPNETWDHIGLRCARSVVPPTAEPTPDTQPPLCGTLSGVITSDLQLTSFCTYQVPEKVLIEENVTVTVGEGTVLKFSPQTYIKVDGALDVQGSIENPVRFTAEDACLGWDGIQITGKSANLSSISHAIFEYGRASGANGVLHTQSSQPQLSDLVFRFNNNPLWVETSSEYTVTVNNSQFMSNTGTIGVFYGSAVVEGNLFQNNQNGLTICPDTLVRNNVFSNNEGTAIVVGSCSGPGNGPTTIISNTISNNLWAITNFGLGRPMIVQGNDIFDNEHNISSERWCGTAMNYNNIVPLSATEIEMEMGDCEVDLTNNYWGTSNQVDIEDRIEDFNDDFERVNAVIEPFAAEPLLNVGADR